MQKINWQTGTPTKNGTYLVTYDCCGQPPTISVLYWYKDHWLNQLVDDDKELNIIAWYNINDIEPYKNNT